MASEENHLLARDDFDPRFYESLGTENPRCASRFGGLTSNSDHDHRCEYDANVLEGEYRCVGWGFNSLSRELVKVSQPHECHCGQAVWVTGQRSVSLDGSPIVS